MSITHAFVSGKADGADTSVVQPSDWNDNHVIGNDSVSYAQIQNVSATDKLLGRSTAGAGDIEEIDCTAAGRALIDDANAGAQRTTLGLGALATKAAVATADIDDDAVTYTKIQNLATDRLLGRDTASSGDAEELTVGGGVEFTGSGGIQRAALTGDVTASAGSNATTIANDAVTYAKMQNVSATDKLLGRSTSGAGDVEEIACTAAGRAILDDADAAAQRTTLGAAAASHTHTSADVTDFTEAAQDAVATALTETAGLDITYNDGANTITFALDLSELTPVTSPDFVNDSAVLMRASTGDRIHGLEALTASLLTADYGKRRNSRFMDFESTSASPLGKFNAGTGSAAGTEIAPTNANQIGVIQIETGTTTTGSAGIGTNPDALLLGNGQAVFEGSFRVPTLSDGTNTYTSRIGFIDSHTADSTDGVYFEYDSSTSANWRVATASNSTRTKTSSATAVDTSFHTFKAVVNAAGSSAAFYIDGAEVSGSPIATNIPTGAGRYTGWGFMILKSAGTTERTLESDWVSWDIDLTTARS